MKPPRSTENELILGLVSISDRASRGVYEDEGIPNLEAWVKKAVTNPLRIHKRLIPDERFDIEKTLRELVDIIGCDLILTTGGTGPARRDVTPEATLAVATRELPGFGEQMRAISGHFVPTAILSRQVGVLRETPDHAALIINLPGRPKAIAETLEGLRDDEGKTIVNGIFAAVPYCIDLIGGPYIETNESVVRAFRPKSARKKPTQESSAESPEPAQEEPQKQPETPEKKEPAVETPPAPEPAAPIEAKPEPPAQPEVQAPPVQPFTSRDILVCAPRRWPGEPALTVVWLHGMGVDNEDFANFPDEILNFEGPACRFVLPNAPMREITGHPGYPLRAWYDLPGYGTEIDQREDAFGVRESAGRVLALIDQLEREGVPRAQLILGGFSQGAAISLYAGLRLKAPIGGIVALSGYLPLAQRLFAEATPAGRATPVFMGHGVFDSVVSPVVAQRTASVIREVNPRFAWHDYNMEHSLCAEEMHDIAAFLREAAARAQAF